MTTVFRSGPVTLNSTDVWQIDDLSFDPRITTYIGMGALIDPTVVALQESTPSISITSPAVERVLGVCGVMGTAITAVDAYFTQRMHEGRDNSGSEHVKLTVNEGIIVPRSITASARGVAALSFDVLCAYDGTNLPIVAAIDQALPASAKPTPELFGCGPIKATIGGSSRTFETQDMTIDFGHTETFVLRDGETYARFVGISQTQPTVTVTTNNFDILDYVETEGIAGTNLYAYLRHKPNKGTYDADATSEHLKFTMTVAHATIQTGSASAGNDGTVQVKFQGVYDMTNAIIAYAANQAIV